MWRRGPVSRKRRALNQRHLSQWLRRRGDPISARRDEKMPLRARPCVRAMLCVGSPDDACLSPWRGAAAREAASLVGPSACSGSGVAAAVLRQNSLGWMARYVKLARCEFRVVRVLFPLPARSRSPEGQRSAPSLRSALSPAHRKASLAPLLSFSLYDDGSR